MRTQTFELIATLAAFKTGKRYLLQNKDLLKLLITSLQETQSEQAAQMKAINSSEAMEHRWLLTTIFRLSQSKASHTSFMESQELTTWLLRYLDQIQTNPHEMTKEAIENVTGILQNTSLKT